MKNFIALLPLVILCSCTTPVTPPPAPLENPAAPDFLYPDKMALKATPNLVIVIDTNTYTNKVVLQWNAPQSGGAPAAGVVGYNVYFGTNSGKYLSFLNTGSTDTNYTLVILDQCISTNPVVRVSRFSDGTTVTNSHKTYLALTALYDPAIVPSTATGPQGFVESDPSAEIFWPPPPPPPWSAIIVSWGKTPRNVTLLSIPNLKTTNWNTVTNVTGTNVMLPIAPNALFLKGITPDAPPIQLQINGAYLHGTN